MKYKISILIFGASLLIITYSDNAGMEHIFKNSIGKNMLNWAIILLVKMRKGFNREALYF
ncbi:hypothetical protein [Clostridium sp.]|uniref:hypothetical protein n=1 Tax=Clostridium sp. TaxID=1506 RepID=UPI00262B9721|nr:hypothetical protein [Clostridium sp.]